MTEKRTCPNIPLKRFRHTTLPEYIKSILHPTQGTPVQKLYDMVLGEFGEEICRPAIMCGHNGKEAEPEFCHVVRWVLQDGKKEGWCLNETRNRWTLCS